MKLHCRKDFINNLDWFTTQIIRWSNQHGRKDLPWQRICSPYHVWVAEIMLQQTQVATVIKYFDRFLERFPDVDALHTATQNEVLQAWHGLGYYRRALNMHKTASIVVNNFAGEFPQTVAELCTLPGIGRSTAGSMLATVWNISAPILEANVRRVLSRYHGLNGPATVRIPETELWQLAELHTPSTNARTYNQAIMDFGATWCTRRAPQCGRCPLSSQCKAFQADQVAEFPVTKMTKVTHRTTMRPWVIFACNFDCLLRPRGPTGIYASMWDTPELGQQEHPDSALQLFQLSTHSVRLLSDVSKTRYRISNKDVTEELSVAVFNTASSDLGVPAGMCWTPFNKLDCVGVSVRTMRRIELAKSLVESQ